MKCGLLWFFFSLAALCLQAQEDSIRQRIFLIGDGGELENGKHPVVDWAAKNVNWNDARNSAVFLGDNIYPLGLGQRGESDYEESKKVLDYQLSPFLNKKGRAFFIMGNHDWKNGKMGGWQRARNQYNYINGLNMPNIQALPGDGCPGPVAVELNNQVVVIFVDSQWFLYIHDKPGPSSNCGARTVEEFQTELRELIAQHPNQMVLVVTHLLLLRIKPRTNHMNEANQQLLLAAGLYGKASASSSFAFSFLSFLRSSKTARFSIFFGVSTCWP